VDWLICKSPAGAKLEIGCDIMLGCDVEDAIEMTTFPIEGGSPASDHVIVQPRTLTVNLVQSKTPLERMKQGSIKDVPIRQSDFKPHGLLLLTTMAANAVSGAVSSIMGLSQDAPRIWTYDVEKRDFVNELHKALIDAQRGVYECTVTLKGATYIGMRMIKVSRSYAVTEGDGAEAFTIEFRELKIVSTAVAKLPMPAALKPPVSKGKTGKESAEGNEKEIRKKTMAKKGLEAFTKMALGS
jgi:hypothetical protein